MAAEHATIGVQLIEHDITQVLKEARPASVVRKDSGMEHVGIAEHDVAALADRRPGIARRIAVVGEDAEAMFQALPQFVKFSKLILGERFGGE